MVNIKFEKNQFVYENDKGSTILLDCNDFIKNKSAVPLFSPGELSLTLPYHLVNLHKTYTNLFEEGYAPNDDAELFLIDILAAAQLMKSSLPAKVAELGCTNGRLSYHLASVMGKMHSNSTLCCICDTIGNESGNAWLDMISLVQNAPRLSMLASDYDETNLSSHHFDMVVINASVQMEDADAVIKEARRLAKTNGMILCYAWKRPDMIQSMKREFAAVEEYPINSNIAILTAYANDARKECDKVTEWKKEAYYDLAQAEAALMASAEGKELVALIQKMNYHAEYATEHKILDIKVKSIEIKEKLLMKYVDGKGNN